MGCVEQGLLLFQVRNELRSTINCYRRGYESAVLFGVRKSLRNHEITSGEHNVEEDKITGEEEEEAYKGAGEGQSADKELTVEQHRGEHDRMRAYYECELVKREEIIAQQRAVIKALGGGGGAGKQ